MKSSFALFIECVILGFRLASCTREYIFINTPVKWVDADAYCQHVGTRLATILTTEDRAAAVAQYNSSSTDKIWMGLNRGHDGDWHWYDGTPCVSGGHYCTPDSRSDWWLNTAEGEDCGAMHKNNNGLFNDWYCDDARNMFTILCNAPLYKFIQKAPVVSAPVVSAPVVSAKYIFINTPLKWVDAEAYCANTYGTHLATVLTDADKAIASATYGTSSTDKIWMGLNRQGTTDDWHWYDGTPCVSGGDTHYCTPDSGSDWWLNTGEGEDCGAMHKNHNGVFNDWYCNDARIMFTFLCNGPPVMTCPRVSPQQSSPAHFVMPNNDGIFDLNGFHSYTNYLVLLLVILNVVFIVVNVCVCFQKKQKAKYVSVSNIDSEQEAFRT